MDFLNKKPSMLHILIALFVLLLIVNESEQQFSYSANWGKRSSNNDGDELMNLTPKINCRNALKLKQMLHRSSIRFNQEIKEYLNLKIDELCNMRQLREEEINYLDQKEDIQK